MPLGCSVLPRKHTLSLQNKEKGHIHSPQTRTPSPFCTHLRAPPASRTTYTVLRGRTHLNSRSSCVQAMRREGIRLSNGTLVRTTEGRKAKEKGKATTAPKPHMFIGRGGRRRTGLV